MQLMDASNHRGSKSQCRLLYVSSRFFVLDVVHMQTSFVSINLTTKYFFNFALQTLKT